MGPAARRRSGSRGVACVVVTLDPAAFDRHAPEARPPAESGRRPTRPPRSCAPSATRALRHALAEYELPAFYVDARAARSARSWPDEPARSRSRRPRAGSPSPWSLLMCLTGLGDRRRPLVLGRASTRLPADGRLGGVLVGFIGPKVGWGRWPTYLVGALLRGPHRAARRGALAAGDPGASLGATVSRRPRPPASTPRSTSSSRTAVHDPVRPLPAGPRPDRLGDLDVRVVRGRSAITGRSTRSSWSASSSSSTWSITINDQLRYLVIFSLAALFLLIRFHALDEQREWLRRRIGDPARSRASTCAAGRSSSWLAVVGSLRADPDGGVGAAGGRLGRRRRQRSSSLSRSFQRFLPTGGPNRSLGADLRPERARSSRLWTDRRRPGADDPACRRRDDGTYYWRAVDLSTRST